MILTCKQQLKLKKKQYKKLKELCFFSKNLYNVALYNVRQYFFNNKQFLSYANNCSLAKTNENFKLLQAGIAQQVIKKVNDNFSSFFEVKRKKKKGQYDKKVKLPKYKDINGLFQLIFRDSSCIKNGVFKLPLSRQYKKENKFCLEVKIPKTILDKKIKQVRLNPILDGLYFELEYIYEVQDKIELGLDNEKILGIDLGLNNLLTCVENNGSSIIIDGRKIKSINQYYNKQVSKYKSKIKKGKSKKIQYITHKRNNRIQDYISKAVRIVINHCLKNKIGKIVLGYNEFWKNKIKIGKVNNQNFVQLPFHKIKSKLEYLSELYGIELKVTEESYTSKCSFLNNEALNKQVKYKGRRIRRGLFKDSRGYILNADVNGALNIIRKVNPESEALLCLRNRGCVAQPKRIAIL